MTARATVALEPPPVDEAEAPPTSTGQQNARPYVPPPSERPGYVAPPAATVGAEPLGVRERTRTGEGLQTPTFATVDRILSFGLWTEIKKGSLTEAPGTRYTSAGSIKPLLRFQLRSGGDAVVLAEAVHGWAPLETEDAVPSHPTVMSMDDVTPLDLLGDDASPFFSHRPSGRF